MRIDLKVWKRFQYYAIIGLISLIAVFFLPFIGSSAGLKWNLPDTAVGWVVYVISKLIVATINILLFHCFILQAKVNVKDDPNFVQANEILKVELNLKELKPKSPAERHREVYGKKGITIFVTSLLSAIGLTQAVLSFDLVSMLTYLFTIILGLIFGILAMNDEEEYWTVEYLWYAQELQKTNAELREKESNVNILPSEETTADKEFDSLSNELQEGDNECLQSETQNIET